MIPRTEPTRTHGMIPRIERDSDTPGSATAPGSAALSSAEAAGARQMTPAPAAATATVNFVDRMSCPFVSERRNSVLGARHWLPGVDPYPNLAGTAAEIPQLLRHSAKTGACQDVAVEKLELIGDDRVMLRPVVNVEVVHTVVHP